MTSTLPIPQPSLRGSQSADAELPMASIFARTLRTLAEREQFDLSATPLAAPAASMPPAPRKKGPAPAGSPLTPGASLKKKEAIAPEPPQPAPAQEAVPEKPTVQQPAASGLLTRGWAWLKKNNKFAAARQLRVAETVSLGEKRFVSVILVDGQKFLIGGGSQSVTLLTQLGAAQAASEALEAMAKAGEQLK